MHEGSVVAVDGARGGTVAGDRAGGRALPTLSGHVPALDGLRGWAIVLVMLCHFIPHADHPSSVPGKLFFFVSHAGWCGVDLFFVLSGFLITGILLDAKGTPHYFRNFYARRTLRIFPLYYFVLAVVFVVVPMAWPGAFASAEGAALRRQQWALWSYATNMRMTAVNDIDVFRSPWVDLNPFWSLAIEEQFYLLWPTVVFFVSRRAVAWACAAVIAGSFALRAWMFRHGNMEWGIYVFTPCRADALAFGGLLAALLRGGGGAGVSSVVRHAGWATSILGVVWLASLAANPERDRLWSMTVGYTLAGAFFAALLVFSLVARPGSVAGLPFNHWFMRGLGKYSYGLYVYHVVLHETYERWFGQRAIEGVLRGRLHLGGAAYGASVLLYIGLAGAASFAVAFASWHLFEKQFLRLKRFFEYRKRAVAT